MINVLLTIICGLAVFALAYFGNFLRGLYDINKNSLPPIINLSVTPAPKNSANILGLDSNLRLAYMVVDDSNKISLFPNLENHKTAKALFKEKNCKTLVNGGFYSGDNKHIGLFVSEGNKISDFKENSLFNGVFAIATDSARIGERISTDNAHIAVQSGPILILDGKTRTLSIKNDENERRMVAAVTKENKVVFLIIYNKESVYLGPKLEEVPELLNEFSRLTGIPLASALNLDGGTASAFYADGVSFGELTKIGSYFCIM